MKKVPMRMCVACREMKPKKELIRVIRTPDNEVRIDAAGRQNGRGSYLCPSSACFMKARKTGAFARALKINIPDEIYDHLMEEIEEIETER